VWSYLDDPREPIAALAVAVWHRLDPRFDMTFLTADTQPRVRFAAVRVSGDAMRLNAIAADDVLVFVHTGARISVWVLAKEWFVALNQ
jgi:hypothetical protein